MDDAGFSIREDRSDCSQSVRSNATGPPRQRLKVADRIRKAFEHGRTYGRFEMAEMAGFGEIKLLTPDESFQKLMEKLEKE